ncbi:MAG TPA: SDR family NAD(P)-dependent oxidoreductase [Candidatus Dormibacteraeota bacterium]|nr:SDR family NAD(P)-dependent oxidoreductase [Candidatus Dormibacteraeota bacterium]
MEIAGKVAVVTGGGSGIGAALSRRLAADGAAAVVVADRNEEAARDVAAEIGAEAVGADVTVESDVKDLVRHTIDNHQRVDIYFSNAGVGLGQGPESPDAEWQQSWEVHVMGHVYASRALLPDWLERGEGYFVGTVSAAGLLNQVLSAPYGVTKAAGLSFMEWIAINYGDRGVRVSALCPQGVKTPMLNMSGSTFLDEGALEPAQVAEAVVLGVREEQFLILPHPEVSEYFRRKGDDYERWIRGMRRLRARLV